MLRRVYYEYVCIMLARVVVVAAVAVNLYNYASIHAVQYKSAVDNQLLKILHNFDISQVYIKDVLKFCDFFNPLIL